MANKITKNIFKERLIEELMLSEKKITMTDLKNMYFNRIYEAINGNSIIVEDINLKEIGTFKRAQRENKLSNRFYIKVTYSKLLRDHIRDKDTQNKINNHYKINNQKIISFKQIVDTFIHGSETVKTKNVVIKKDIEKEIVMTNTLVGSLFLFDEKIYKREKNDNNRLKYTRIHIPKIEDETKISDVKLKKLKSLIELKITFQKLVALEYNSPLNTEEMKNLRTLLNHQYDSLIKKRIYLNNPVTISILQYDENYSSLLGLEKEYTKEVKKSESDRTGKPITKESSKKADIFFKRTHFPEKKREEASFKITLENREEIYKIIDSSYDSFKELFYDFMILGYTIDIGNKLLHIGKNKKFGFVLSQKNKTLKVKHLSSIVEERRRSERRTKDRRTQTKKDIK